MFNVYSLALDLLTEAIRNANYCGKILIGMDVAASEMYENGKYNLGFKDNHKNPDDNLSSDKLSNLYNDLVMKYPIISIEDPFDQDDWEPWVKLTARTRIQVSFEVYNF